MSKRTIIILIVAVVLLAAAFLSLWWEYRSIIAEAKTIIEGEEYEEPGTVKTRKNKTVKTEPDETITEETTGAGSEEQSE